MWQKTKHWSKAATTEKHDKGYDEDDDDDDADDDDADGKDIKRCTRERVAQRETDNELIQHEDAEVRKREDVEM